MGRRLFGTRRHGHLPGAVDWPRLPGALRPAEAATAGIPLPTPPPASAVTRASAASPPPEEELLDKVAAFRSAVADSLYEISKDYQMLCI